MILDRILEQRKKQLAREKENRSLESLKKLINALPPSPFSFEQALAKPALSVIAEVKKASPSQGIIKKDFHPALLAALYEHAGADAISVLTEKSFFQGHSLFLQQIRKVVNLPILRKDFLTEPYQIYESRALGADAILLIAAILPKPLLAELLALAKELSLACLVEVHNEKELERALSCNAEIIGINNRNLLTFETTLETTEKLLPLIPADKLVVSESGMKNPTHLKQVEELGANAVLIGETLMRSDNIPEELKRLRCHG